MKYILNSAVITSQGLYSYRIINDVDHGQVLTHRVTTGKEAMMIIQGSPRFLVYTEYSDACTCDREHLGTYKSLEKALARIAEELGVSVEELPRFEAETYPAHYSDRHGGHVYSDPPTIEDEDDPVTYYWIEDHSDFLAGAELKVHDFLGTHYIRLDRQQFYWDGNISLYREGRPPYGASEEWREPTEEEMAEVVQHFWEGRVY